MRWPSQADADLAAGLPGSQPPAAWGQVRAARAGRAVPTPDLLGQADPAVFGSTAGLVGMDIAFVARSFFYTEALAGSGLRLWEELAAALAGAERSTTGVRRFDPYSLPLQGLTDRWLARNVSSTASPRMRWQPPGEVGRMPTRLAPTFVDPSAGWDDTSVTLESPAAPPRDGDVLDQYEAVDMNATRAFLQSHPELAGALREAPDQVRRVFGPETRLSLRIVHDPEGGGDELMAVIHSSLPQTDSRTALDEFDDTWWLDTDAISSGLLHFTLD